MHQSMGFFVPGQEQRVLKLVTQLFYLNQVRKQWPETFDKVLLSNGLKTTCFLFIVNFDETINDILFICRRHA